MDDLFILYKHEDKGDGGGAEKGRLLVLGLSGREEEYVLRLYMLSFGECCLLFLGLAQGRRNIKCYVVVLLHQDAESKRE